jgi:predicted dehydrogenase
LAHVSCCGSAELRGENVSAVVRLGIIGCGSVGREVHAKILRRFSNAKLIALADSDENRLEAAAHIAGKTTRLFRDYMELLAQPDLDAVIIALPNAFHAQAAIAAFERHKHVYLEKPMATNLADAQRIITAWKKARVIGTMGFNYRFNIHYQRAKRAVRENQLGRIVAARSVFSTTPRDIPEWQRADGVLLDLGSHHIDLIHDLFGSEISEVSAMAQPLRSADDNVILHCRLANGLLVQSLFSSVAVDEERFEIYGQNGKLTVDRAYDLQSEISPPRHRARRWKKLLHHLIALRGSPYVFQKLRAPWREPSYAASLAAFVKAVATNQQFAPDLHDGFRSLATLIAAQESLRTSRVVSVKT